MPVSGLTSPEIRTVVGILEPGFFFGRDSPDVLLSLGPRTVSVRPIARLAPGVSLDQANDAARAIIQAGETRRPTDGRVVRLADDLLHRPAQSLWVLLAGASLLLLVGCANVAGLLFGDIRSRQREIAVRRALGGGTGSIARQFLVEHLLLVGAASAQGMLLAVWLTGAVVRLAPDRIPRLDAVVVDVWVAVFAVGLGLLTMVGVGIASVLACV
jgi:predicted lysophospholipase L1 biosynthesis ABC-type transport system permease subunit